MSLKNAPRGDHPPPETRLTVALGADHAGFEYQQGLVVWLRARGHEVLDLGPTDEARCDYPDFAARVARAVAAGRAVRGVLICGSGIGMAMCANRVPGVRAAVLSDEFAARMSRAHNDANVACFGARVQTIEQVEALLAVWLATPFEGGRHAGRVAKIDAIGPPS